MFIDIPPAKDPLPDREWHKHLEAMLNFGECNPDILAYMDFKQQWCINEIKKATKRKEYKLKLMGDDPDDPLNNNL